MMTGSSFKLVACAMALLFPLSAMGADMQGAVLYVAKTGRINGAGVSRPTVIFEGDKLQFPSDSAASITMSGTSIAIAPGSTLVFKSKALELPSLGGLVVTTNNGVAVRVQKLTIAPANGKAKYQVARAGREVLISAKAGAVNIFDGSSTRTVAEGNTEAVAVADPAPAPQVPGAAPGAAGGGGGIPTVVAVVVGLAAAGAAAAAAYASSGASNLPRVSISEFLP